ncbi:hypothetical protein AB2N08_17445 [Massilia aurea]|uniref:hypothetical protein n=1 Tax=Massilia aurea TaxID=373040 RepID=UPI003462B578
MTIPSAAYACRVNHFNRDAIMAKYSEERGHPRSPACARSKIALRFDGNTLHASGTKSSLIFPAVSGKPDKKGRFDYSTVRQRIPFQDQSQPANIGFSHLSFGKIIG